MKNPLLLCSVLLLLFTAPAQEKKEIGNLVCEGIPDIPPALMEKMNQYQNTRGAGFVDWTPDGQKILMYTRFGDTPQLHMLDFPGGDRKQITFFKEPVTSARFIPDAKLNQFIYLKDVGGNEFSQQYLFDMNTGKYELISDGGRSQTSLPFFSNSGKQFATVSTRRNGKDYDIYISNTETPKESKLVLQEGGSWSVRDWSPDDNSLLVAKYISSTRSELYVLDLSTSKLEQINPSKEEIAYGSAHWSADHKGLYVVNDQGSEFLTLKYYDIASKKFTALTSSIPWDVVGFTANKARTRMVISANENGSTKLYTVDAGTKKISAINGLPPGVISDVKFNPVNLNIAFSITSAQTPSDIYTYNPEIDKVTRWTSSEVGGLNPSTFTIPTPIEFESFDKKKIPAFYYKPTSKPGEKLPVVIQIHGGPESQYQPWFSSFISFLNNELGVAVIAPNVRGSSGYGKSYLKMDNGFNREESVKDIGALIDWIAKQPELDASRICVYGGSYGGYMVLASLTNFNDKLKCGIDVVGISNFITFLEKTEDYRKDLRRVEYGDERDPKMKDFLVKISPANNVQKITKPLFIIQGLNDPRVPVNEAEQMKQKMRDQKGDVWYLLAKDEGHGFKKKVNVDYMQWSVVSFLQNKLIK
jgi:dipeptidyl aminopeptidase/acylaminoacyl peptidase